MASPDDAKVSSHPPNPEESANFFSRMVFWWIQDILIKGWKAPLQESDVFACPTDMNSKSVTDRANHFWAQEKRKKKPSIGRALVKANLKIMIKILAQCVISSIFLLAPTVLVSKVSSYFDPNSKITQNEALIYGCVLFAVNAGYIAIRNSLYWNLHRLGPTLRIQASTLVYNKACMVSFSALSKTSIGHVITLMSNDAERFNEGFVNMHGVVNIPITFVVAFILSYYTIGLYSTLTAFGTVLLFIPIQFYIGKGVQACRRKAVPHTDKRIKLINETIASMKIIKMYKWESVFKNFIFKVRALETKYVGVFMLLKSSSIAIKYISPLLGLLALLLTKYLTGQTINSEMVFFFLMMAQLLRLNINWSLGAAFLYIPQFSHSLSRIQKFLLIEEQATADSALCIENVNVEIKNGSAIKNGYPENGLKTNHQKIDDIDSDVSLKINHLTSTWGGENSFVLADVDLEVKKKSLIGILGPVGCGKSSIIMSLIQEMEHVTGSIYCPSAIGFYSQVPWIFNGSVRENILFNRPMNEEKLDKIIEACYLSQDLEDLANGLETIVGERGVQLSGGQRARVSLARVVYGEEDVILLDDPLSAVDTKCAAHIFNRLIKGYLKDKTVLLVTHNTEFLSQLDYIYLMNRAVKEGEEIVGRIAEHGTWEELNEKDLIKEQAKLMEEEEQKENEEAETEKKKKEKPKQVKEDRKTGLIDKKMYFKFWNLSFGWITCPIILVMVAGAQAVKILQEEEALTWVERVEAGDSGADSTFVTYVILAIETLVFYSLLVFFIAYAGTESSKALHNMAFNGMIKSPIRFFDVTPIGILINRFSKDTLFCDERLSFVFSQFSSMFTSFLAEEKCKLVEVGKERRYLKLQCGEKFKCPRSDTLYSVEDYKDDPKWNAWAVVCTLKYDTLCPNDPKFYEVCGHSRAGCKGDPSETMFCGAYICGYQDQVYTYMDTTITFGRKLLSGIVNTRYASCDLTKTCSNTDIDELGCADPANAYTCRGEIDTIIPADQVCDLHCDCYRCNDEAVCGNMTYGVNCDSIYGWHLHAMYNCNKYPECSDASMVILCISNYYFILILLPLLLFMTLVLHFYLKTSVEVRRVEATLRSPVLSHVSGTLAGMSTIRASKQIEVYKEQHYRLRDRHTSAQMIFKATERWLSVRLDSIVTFIGFFATLICIFLRDTIGAKLAGLGIVYVQNRMGEFQYCIRLGAECENLMTAVERVFSLADLPPEEDPNVQSESAEVVENNYSSADLKGVVEFRDVSLRYDKSLPFVLHNITFKTKSCEKIGIVGRTGAGKSSIIQALYRMCEVQGTVLIDGTDTSTQTLSELRGSISVIPQESLLFSGTLRDNLDPYLTFSDETLWNTLEQVELKSYISGKGGLMTPIDEMGGNMSVGQRQLLCLARALLKKSSLLVVDEATANVDQETDEAIQKTIRTFFSDRTVLTIAHRLNTIIDSDRIMVMDSGHLVEFDTPDNLLTDTSSIFYSLVHGTDHAQTNDHYHRD